MNNIYPIITSIIRTCSEFPQAVATLQTFDNMLLTAFVELGSLMTLLYLGLIMVIVIRYCRKLWSSPEPSLLGWYRVLVLFGFAIHSLSYDSLLFPSVNWLFHVQLGIMAGYHSSDGARLSHPAGAMMTFWDLVMETEQFLPKRESRRILGLDMGTKRIGLAVSDPLGITAQGLEVWVRRNRQADLDHLLTVGRDYAVQQIVVGLPRHMDGRLGEAAPAITEFAGALGEALGAEVIFWDERLTTAAAERVLIQADVSRRRRRQVVDQLAAVLILQSYLDHREQTS